MVVGEGGTSSSESSSWTSRRVNRGSRTSSARDPISTTTVAVTASALEATNADASRRSLPTLDGSEILGLRSSAVALRLLRRSAGVRTGIHQLLKQCLKLIEVAAVWKILLIL